MAQESWTRGGVVVLAFGALDFGLEQSIVVPALPVLATHYGASLVSVGWLLTGFLLTGIVAVPLLGRLGDLFGKRLFLLVALARVRHRFADLCSCRCGRLRHRRPCRAGARNGSWTADVGDRTRHRVS